MALNKARAVSSAMSKLEEKGFVINNEHSMQRPMVEAIVEAIIEDITGNAKAIDPGGTGSGQWEIK